MDRATRRGKDEAQQLLQGVFRGQGAGTRRDGGGRPGRWKGGCLGVLNRIIDENVHRHHRRAGTVSNKTMENRRKGLNEIFRTLTKELGYGIEDPANLKTRHIQALVDHWTRERELSPGTIAQNLYYLNTFCGWIGRPGLVKGLKAYAPEYGGREYAAKRDKSPREQADLWPVWEAVYAEDRDVAMIMLAVMAFGLRVKEAVCLKPSVHIQAGFVQILDGSKGGRRRQVYLDTPFKERVAGLLIEHVRDRRANAFLGSPRLSLQQNLRRYYYVVGERHGVNMVDSGFTSHSFRQEFACDELERRGLVPTVRGGSGKVDAEGAVDRHATDVAYLQVSELLGHSRKSVMSAYCGPFRRRVQAGKGGKGF